ncbi:MAG: YraN family protein [Mariprofundus sp.]
MGTLHGRIGETQACHYLRHRGYRILDRNARLGRGELDIVALHHDLLIFVEVKAHQDRESALLAVDQNKCARLRSAAEMWRSLHLNYADRQCRFDLIIITPRLGWAAWLGPRIEQMEDIIR